MTYQKAYRQAAGFTLIEIIVVVAIIALMAAAILPRVMDRPEEARIAKVKQDISALESALNLYKLDNYKYPTTDQGLEALIVKPTDPEPPKWKEGGYINRLPNDPWQQPYQYLSPGEHGAFDVYSLGPDQQPSDDDIGNWNIDAVQ